MRFVGRSAGVVAWKMTKLLSLQFGQGGERRDIRGFCSRARVLRDFPTVVRLKSSGRHRSHGLVVPNASRSFFPSSFFPITSTTLSNHLKLI